MDIYRVLPYLGRAKELLKASDEHSKRYAALELRFALENVVYRQMLQYGDVLPGKVLSMWKPDQMLKALISFDPINENGGELAFALRNGDELPADSDFKDIGSTKAIPWKEFRKYYNKLGSYLHTPVNQEAAQKVKKIAEEDFAKIINCLEEVAKATAVFAFKAVVFGTCQCENVLYVGQREFDNEDLVLCSNRRCNLLWSKWTESDGTQLLVKVETIIFECADCQAVIPVPPAQMWQPIRCSNCSSRFRVEVRLSKVEEED
ncbi:hypothetical protein RX830_01450 [Pseudomonas syringae pv. actinidiae]|uniref:Uncharacterized protein n=1 Tax=Pseudomonas syringae pv. actinidiae ICMP 19096 TaxID=1194405 RepID=A0A656JS57_PSESF|nr:hypothetical protein [Pseudomonas syringae]EPN48727.1 hypothetical protein A245_29720 [Pseudomonas syringae pv. actinidiae ICMP 19096]MDU8264688.1 hypothetical protein [Pseudomonas syringae pv. actinidiae]POD52898.1 hypothetical protein BKM15_13510 [Pseudomonas syringae pv. syringae]EPM48635.1 hypothetical protein A246_10711 [Pseudomonas syringae pv. actinidiae ICMP 19098]EPN35181.1 hypothetical protein A243_10991 [Pseudomonas syringae pv. actinidiae ICMP 18883]